MAVSSHTASSPRLRFWLPWISALVFVAGLVTFLIVYNVGGIRNMAPTYKTRPSTQPAQRVRQLGPHVPLPKAARLTAAEWIRAAVGRNDLVKAWKLTAPELRRGFTLSEWKSGNIPVVPYPIGNAVAGITRIDWSTRNDVSLEVTLVPKKGAGIRAQDFFINLRTVGSGAHRRWLVYYWAPRALPSVLDVSH